MNRKINHLVLIFLLICSMFSSLFITFNNTASAAASTWWDTDWMYSKKVTINSSLVNESLTHFPILFQHSSADFINSARTDGYDFRFLNETNETAYYFEIENYNSTTGTLTAWVNITSLSNTTDTIMWLYYGNTSASSDPSSTSTWNKDYLAVYHLNSTLDSTANNYDLVANGASYNTSGKRAGCYDFELDDGSDNMSNLSLLDTWPAEVTFEAWFNAESTNAGQNMYIMSKECTAANVDALAMWVSGPSNVYVSQSSNGGGMTHSDTTFDISTSTWYYGACTYKDNDNVRPFINGYHYVSVDLTTLVIQDGSAFDFVLGNIRNAAVYDFDGRIDEVRVSQTNRSNAWINTTYYTINNPELFLTVGIERNDQVDPPTSFVAYTESTSNINVSWTMGTNATHTRIQRSTTTYPTSRTDGTNVYNSTGTYCNDTGLTRAVTYYYAAWSYDSTTGNWSGDVMSFNYTGPADSTNVDTEVIGNDINISWTTGTNADFTLVVRKDGSFPTGPTDGTTIYNGTGLYYVDSNALATYHYTVYSWCNATNLFSAGVDAEWGTLNINCYDENTSQALTFGVFITNNEGTQTYNETTCTNTHRIDLEDLPLGDNVLIIINSTNYISRHYYLDMEAGNVYTLNAFLPRNETHQHLLRVVDPNNAPVEGVKLHIMKYINESAGYENVSIVLTGAYGDVEVSLISNVTYKIRLSKSGYETSYENYIPITPDAYGNYYTKTFLINFETTGPELYLFDDVITFNATINASGYITVCYYDNLGNTTDTYITIYENYNGTIVLNNSDSRSSDNDFCFTTSGYNASRYHFVKLHMNHTNLGHAYATLDIAPVKTPYTEKSLEDKFENVFGEFELGWIKTFVIFFPCMMLLVVFGAAHSGLGIIGAGAYLAFTTYFIEASTAMQVSYGTLAGIIITIGVAVIIAKRGWKVI